MLVFPCRTHKHQVQSHDLFTLAETLENSVGSSLFASVVEYDRDGRGIGALENGAQPDATRTQPVVHLEQIRRGLQTAVLGHRYGPSLLNLDWFVTDDVFELASRGTGPCRLSGGGCRNGNARDFLAELARQLEHGQIIFGKGGNQFAVGLDLGSKTVFVLDRREPNLLGEEAVIRKPVIQLVVVVARVAIFMPRQGVGFSEKLEKGLDGVINARPY